MTYFTESLDPANNGRQIEEPVTRRYADMRAEFVGPVFTRVFTPDNGFAERLKHVVEPAFTLQRITSIDNLNQIPTTASYEYVVGGTTRFTYGLTNRLLVRRPTAKDAAPPPAADRGRAARVPQGGREPELLHERGRQPLRQRLQLLGLLPAAQQLLHGGAVSPRDAGAGRGRGRAHGVRPDCGANGRWWGSASMA